ncbi:hypothetical protein AAZX31_20G173100 [Glycine max]
MVEVTGEKKKDNDISNSNTQSPSLCKYPKLPSLSTPTSNTKHSLGFVQCETLGSFSRFFFLLSFSIYCLRSKMVSDANKKKVANEIVDILDFGFDLHLSPEIFKRKRPEGKKKKKGKRLQRKRHTRQPRAKKNAENGHALCKCMAILVLILQKQFHCICYLKISELSVK